MTHFLKAAVNGGRTRSEAPSVPLSPDEIARESVMAHRLGAAVVHAHARTADGGQTIRPADVAAMVRAIRAADHSIVVGTTTGLWTCTSHADRMAQIAGWHDDALPDFASVAFSEEGAAEAAELLVSRGIELESAVWGPGDVPALLASSTLHENVRILIETFAQDPEIAVAECRAIAHDLRAAGVAAPLLYHGMETTAWPVLEAAIADGVQARIGLEDVLVVDGVLADNEAMIRRALALACP